ncbi:hypothetical protein V5O48_004053 [Marasmius crinis-equi]|uniref:Nephrocystin 3-like N-terminal domain-containing protein n=1 Tax=Marasmius crinis-equi TaxID=585013 RepID=A0ABR3FRJ2_9AGAR
MNVNHGRDQNFTSGHGTTVINNSPSESGLQKLATHAAFSALHNSKSRGPETRCLRGTRERVIEELSHWIESADSEQLCWFYGGAGVGKSAVAQTICEKYRDSHLAASFFYSHNDSSRNSLDPLIPTIAHQLATNPTFENAGFTSAINEIIQTKPGVFDMRWDDQFEWLIREPLARIKLERDELPILIVIDGLDECMGRSRSTSDMISSSTSDAIKAQETLLSIIQNATSAKPPLPLRFLILSRPEHAIRHFFRSTPSKPGPAHKPVDMRDFRPEADRDIRLFLEEKFAALPDLHPEAMIQAGWPGEDIILNLVHKSDGHFIYVVTAMKYISQRDDPELKLPQQRLNIILRTDETLHPDLSDLDQLYHHILRQFTNVRERMLLPILQLLVTTHHRPDNFSDPFRYTDFEIPWRSRHSIAKIVDLDSRQVATIFSRLHSVFRVSEDHEEDSYVSFLHASFSEFLTERRRSHDFYVQPMDRHSYLDLLSRRLLPILAAMTHRYQAGDNQVQLVDWTTKIEIRSINVWTFVKKALASQSYIPSDGLISALNSFDMFQYVNMLLDWLVPPPNHAPPAQSYLRIMCLLGSIWNP